MQLLVATASIKPESRTKLWDDLENLVASEPAASPRFPERTRGNRSADEGVLVLDLGDGKGVLIDAAHITPWISKTSGELPLEEFQTTAAAWMLERRQILWRLRLAEEVIAFSDELGGATETETVVGALINHVPRVVESYGAALFVDNGLGASSLAASDPLLPEGTSIHLTRDIGSGGVFSADTMCESHPLRPLIDATRAASVLVAPVTGVGILAILETRRDRVFEAEEIAVVRTLATQASSAIERIRLFSDVRELSLTDPLTGLANRRHLELVLEREIAAARRGEPLSVVLMDLDYFKEINDHLGHSAGDKVLREFASNLREVVRASDVVVRYGGDEFLIVLVSGTAAGAASLVRRLRRRATSVSFSVGIAEFDVNVLSAEHLIDLADHALYEAKRRRPMIP